ncbi:FHA domain-containing protein [Streptomyces glomeratus]|uniref:FHA domain-containing protein n=1 Tax=Streptomyces glomeratus TaxID=284452 RepID=A0ABP6M614_9ACTN|nr:FHA domain-containing protein [Streptomyces glomeratus]MCF1506998.1 FHA domain-containing protein [Streptomyces glomeratus]
MLELTMASVSAADAGATAGMMMADAPSDPGSVLRVGRDKSVCRLATPDDWLFVSRVHLEFLCGPERDWQVSWLRGSLAEPSSEVVLALAGQPAQTLPYGGTVRLPRGASGELVIRDRAAPRSVNVGFYHEAHAG